MSPFAGPLPNATYYRLAQNRGDGIYVWASLVYTDIFPFLIAARLRGTEEGYVFAASRATRLQEFLDRFNQGKGSVCISIRDLLSGIPFLAERMEREIDEEHIEKPPNPEEEAAFQNRLLFVKWLYQEKGQFDEWAGQGHYVDELGVVQVHSPLPITPQAWNPDRT